MLELAETAEPRIVGSEQEHWLNRLDPEWENIRAAADWTLKNGQDDMVLRTLGAIRRFCTARRHVTEARGFLERALAVNAADQSTVYCRGHIAAGNLAEDQGDLDIARVHFVEARALAVELGNKTGEAQALIGLGYVANGRGDFTAALTFHTQAATIAREIHSQHILGTALGNMASVSYFQGNLADAQRYWEEAGHIFKTLGDHLTEALALGNLGAVAAEQGEFDRAERLQHRVLELHRRLGNAPNIALALVNLGAVSCHLGDYTLAHDQLAEAIPMLRELGYKGPEGIALHTLAAVAFAEADSRRSASLILESVRLLSEVGDQFNIAGNIDLLAKLCAARRDHGSAIELMAAAAGLRVRLGAVPNPVNAAELDELERSLRLAVTRGDYARHWQVGGGLDFDTLVRRAGIVAREIVGPRRPQPVFAEPGPPEPRHNLTNRELELLRLLAQGHSTREISDTLYISPRTTTTHLNNIFGKLEVSSRAAAVAYALRSGLV
ncbi:MAG: tetratricopeptide repeat protein [Chloroflexia bacterium]|nr:tetratricopeptide repeat protein [Chloroflexia bacterium]